MTVKTVTLYGHQSDYDLDVWEFSANLVPSDTHFVHMTYEQYKPIAFGPIEKLTPEDFEDD